jgi:hypothetical protein
LTKEELTARIKRITVTTLSLPSHDFLASLFHSSCLLFISLSHTHTAQMCKFFSRLFSEFMCTHLLQEEEVWITRLANEKTLLVEEASSSEKIKKVLPLDDAAKLLTFYRTELERLSNQRWDLQQKLNGNSLTLSFPSNTK